MSFDVWSGCGRTTPQLQWGFSASFLAQQQLMFLATRMASQGMRVAVRKMLLCHPSAYSPPSLDPHVCMYASTPHSIYCLSVAVDGDSRKVGDGWVDVQMHGWVSGRLVSARKGHVTSDK
jgi:hypothetical protein